MRIVPFQSVKKFSYYSSILRYFGLKTVLKLANPKILDAQFKKKHKAYYEIYQKKIVRSDGNYLILTVNHRKLFLRKSTSDILVFKQIYMDYEYQPVVDRLKKLRKRNDAVFILDIGANIGISTCYFKSHFPQAKILAIEPDQENFEVLNKNTSTYSDIYLKCLAIWWEKAKLIMDTTFRDKESWSRRVVDDPGSKVKPIEATTLKEALEGFAYDTIDLLKIDIEGAEREMVKKDLTFLNVLSKVRVISIEVHEEFISEGAVISFLEAASFEVVKSGELLIGVKRTVE